MELFHVLNRGVDKRKIFIDEKDHFRFIHDLFEFNDEKRANDSSYIFRQSFQSSDVRRPKVREESHKPRKLLVKIHSFCLMPNHYHLLLTPVAGSGVQLFMKKLNGGYAKYFNEKYERKGALFEGRYKRILIEDETHFTHLPFYIHFNPLDLAVPEWREWKVKDYGKAINFLENYRWSSHLDYLGKKNFPSVTQRDFLLEVFGGEKEYEKRVKSWLRELNLEGIKDFVLE